MTRPPNPNARTLSGSIGDMSLWGMPDGEWWEAGSGSWTQESGALSGLLGDDPKRWAWISSPLPFPSEFELTCTVTGNAALVGFGFGANKDFLTPLVGQRSIDLRLVVADGSGLLHANGQPVQPQPRTQLSITDATSIATGRLQLKAKEPDGPFRFSEIYLRPLNSSS